MELIDGQASVAVMRIARTTVAAISMDETQFLRPFDLQDLMCMEAYVTDFEKQPVEVFAKVVGEHLMTGERFLGFYCFMTFVILDPEKQTVFNRLIPETEGQETLMAAYSQRVKQRQAQRRKQQEFLSHILISKSW